jgi:hypothetical protein
MGGNGGLPYLGELVFFNFWHQASIMKKKTAQSMRALRSPFLNTVFFMEWL